MHFMELLDSEGSEILRVDVNGECVTEVIQAGDYVMSIHHDGRTGDTLPIFIIPNPEDMEQARKTDGLINRFKIVTADILKVIQGTVTKDAEAQTVEENINTLLRTGRCRRCDLSRADLSGADLREVTMVGANLTSARLISADLSGVSLVFANFTVSDLFGANLRRTNLSGARLRNANLTDADLSRTNFGGATWCNVVSVLIPHHSAPVAVVHL